MIKYMDKILAWSLVLMAAYTVYVVLSQNHLYIG